MLSNVFSSINLPQHTLLLHDSYYESVVQNDIECTTGSKGGFTDVIKLFTYPSRCLILWAVLHILL